ncbi:MAG: glutamate--cysteine ligase, partial [Ectothiorhodospiraceae bacterium]|nr:glutamate--cysteine ligase [Ectothiorhodospiraceae bacterium]
MGDDSADSRFSQDDFHRFAQALRDETLLLKEWLRDGLLASDPPRAGFELEAWLLDREWRPAPVNAAFLERLNDAYAVPELAQFNIELNGPPEWLSERPFTAMHRALESLWGRCQVTAEQLQVRPLLIGILPTAREEDFTLASMSQLPRYRALNEQVLQLRNRQPLKLDIRGAYDSISLEHADVMLEAAATSLQLHLQLPPALAGRYYNAATLLSAATVGLAANSPYLFGSARWQETRIPLFEQAVAVGGGPGGRSVGPFRRVSFGSGYGRANLYGLFVENRQHYPVLLPVCREDGPERLAHLKLHNGTIWRWNRPLVDFDENGRCHLRLEHRVMSAGPSLVDTVANAAFFQGAVHALARRERPMETEIPFPVAERNFYSAARHGLAAEITWLDGRQLKLRDLILESLLPKARQGLESLGLAAVEYQ